MGEVEGGICLEIPGLAVHEEVGEGGFGVVYLATQTGTFKRRVALKVLKAGLDTRAVLRRFEVEQQALALLDHANIARIYDSGETEKGYPFFTMEFIEGFPITEAMEGKDLRSILTTFLQVCSAVSHAHERGVIHRDLKPSNILVTAGGSPKVIDFGIAKATRPELTPGMTVYTGAGGYVGTPDYMAPEQAEPGGLDVDERSDVFSLGAIFQGLLGERAPKALLRVAGKASASQSSERYQTVDDFAKELRRYLDGGQVQAKVRWQGKAYAVLFVVAALLGAWKFWPEEATDQVIFHPAQGGVMTPIIREDGRRALVVFRDGGPTLLLNPATAEKIAEVPPRPAAIRSASFSDDGTQFLIGYYHGKMRWFESETGKPLSGFVDISPIHDNTVGIVREITLPGEEGATTFTQVGQEAILRAWDGDGKQRWECDVERAAWGFTIRPDRVYGALGGGGGAIRIVDLRNGIRTHYIEGSGRPTSGLISSLDGRFLLSAELNGVIRQLDWDGNEIRRWQPSDRCEGVSLSPGGEYFASADGDGGLRLWDLETGELVREFWCEGAVWNSAFSPDGKYLAATGADLRVRVWEVATGKEKIEPWVMDQKTFRISMVNAEGGDLYLIAGTSNDGVRFRKISR